MTESEILNFIIELENSFGTKLDMAAQEAWIRRFRKYKEEVFGQAVERLIRTSKYFPRLASVYQALNEIEKAKYYKPKGKVVEPITIYRDPETGYTFVHCTPTGIDDDPSSKLVQNGIEYELIFRAKESQYERRTE